MDAKLLPLLPPPAKPTVVLTGSCDLRCADNDTQVLARARKTQESSNAVKLQEARMRSAQRPRSGGTGSWPSPLCSGVQIKADSQSLFHFPRGVLLQAPEPALGVGSIRRWPRLDSASVTTCLGGKRTSGPPALEGSRLSTFVGAAAAESNGQLCRSEPPIFKGQSRIKAFSRSTSRSWHFQAGRGRRNRQPGLLTEAGITPQPQSGDFHDLVSQLPWRL